MALQTVTSTFPYYYYAKSSYNLDGIGVSAGDLLGIKYSYDTNMVVLPLTSTSLASDSPYVDESKTAAYGRKWCSGFPFKDAVPITNVSSVELPSITIPGQQYVTKLKVLGTIDNKEVALYFYLGNYRDQEIYASLSLVIGSQPSSFSASGLIYSGTLNSGWEQKIASILSGAEYFLTGYYNPRGQGYNTTTLYSYGYIVALRYQGSCVYNAFSPDGSNYPNLTYWDNTQHIDYYEPPAPPEPPTPSTDPYSPGGYSNSGGGNGDYDTTSDPIPIPGLPANLASSTGLFTAYNPDAGQLANFADKVWNKDPTTIDDWFRMLFGGDAFNAIIGLSMIPVQPSVGSSKEIYLGNWATGASAPKITNQYKDVNFGSVTLNEFWGNSIDYSPYTRVQLALPYIGIVDVDTDDVIGSVNTLTYHIDVLSGALCAMLHCAKGNLSSVIYQWAGSCAVSLPITGSSFNAVMGAIMAVGGSVGAAAAIASGPIGAALGTAGSMALGTGIVSGAAANMFGSMKGKIQKSGNFNANSGALGIMTPYFIITRPVQSIPSTQQITKGYPANISAHLGDLTGYTELEEVHLHNIPGTKDEVLEIESLLKKGVIF